MRIRLSQQCLAFYWLNVDTKVEAIFLHIPLSRTAVKNPVIIHEYVHISSFVMRATSGHWMYLLANLL